MKKSLIILLSLVVLVLSAYGKSEKERTFLIRDGFATVRSYMQFTENEKKIYAIGFFNGLTLAPFVVNEKGSYNININNTLLKTGDTGITGKQLAAILSKYFEEHPGVWHKGLNTESYFALQDAFFPLGISHD